MYFIPVPHRAARLHTALLDDTFDRFFGPASQPQPAVRAPKVDIVEAETAYTMTAELPGIGKDDVKVSIDGRKVVISAEAKNEKSGGDSHDDNLKVIHRERATASWTRSFTLPVDLDSSVSNAKMDNGVLTVVLVKKLAPAALQLSIN